MTLLTRIPRNTLIPPISTVPGNSDVSRPDNIPVTNKKLKKRELTMRNINLLVLTLLTVFVFAGMANASQTATYDEDKVDLNLNCITWPTNQTAPDQKKYITDIEALKDFREDHEDLRDDLEDELEELEEKLREYYEKLKEIRTKYKSIQRDVRDGSDDTGFITKCGIVPIGEEFREYREEDTSSCDDRSDERS